MEGVRTMGDLKIKRYITCLVPVHACNFRCTYCYLGQHIDSDPYGGGVKLFSCSPKHIAEFFSVDRTGGLCYFNLCAAGETLMHPQVIELAFELTKVGHFVDIVTNGTLSRKFDELIATLDNSQRTHMFIKFSFHYLELKRKDMMECFLDNVRKIRDSGISFSIEITPHDDLIPYIKEIKSFSIEKFGALPHITVARNEATSEIIRLTNLSNEEYETVWNQFDSELFRFKNSIFEKKRCEFCHAGLWSLSVNLEDGYYSQCYIGERLGNIADIHKPICFRAIGMCHEPHCFNGHAFLGFGNIVEIGRGTTYTAMRNRNTKEGDWLSKECEAFFSSKLYDNNLELSESEKKRALRNNKIAMIIAPLRKAIDKGKKLLSKKDDDQ